MPPHGMPLGILELELFAAAIGERCEMRIKRRGMAGRRQRRACARSPLAWKLCRVVRAEPKGHSIRVKTDNSIAHTRCA